MLLVRRSAAPSSNPRPHRHLTLEPLKHRLADLKIANDSLVLTKHNNICTFDLNSRSSVIMSLLKFSQHDLDCITGNAGSTSANKVKLCNEVVQTNQLLMTMKVSCLISLCRHCNWLSCIHSHCPRELSAGVTLLISVELTDGIYRVYI